MKALEGIEEVDANLWADTDLERLHLNSDVLSAIGLKLLVPLLGHVMEVPVENVDVVV